MIAATIGRLYGISFGLPALYDPDEPVFILLALGLLRGHTLNPHWFGHPGTTTIYALACIDLLVYGVGHLIGSFSSTATFGHAIYADPTIVFLPGRLFVALCGVACVYLTFVIGRRLFDARTGLIAAGLLALNPLHIQFSQVVRTDMHASVFMLLCVLCSINIMRRGRMMDYVGAGVLVGLACATKWPAAAIVICPLFASLMRIGVGPSDRLRLLGHAAIIGFVSVAALILASPYIVLDYQTVILNLHGEARLHHPGATGGGFIFNLGWYLSHPLRDSIGLLGLLLSGVGGVIIARRDRVASVAIIPAVVTFGIIISTQALIWSRWIVPLLPFISILIAVAIRAIYRRATLSFGRRPALLVESLLCLCLAVPMIVTTLSEARERLHDTRDLASAWTQQHIPHGSSIVIESLSADIWRGGWKFLFPAGGIGCVDTAAALQGKVRFSSINKWQNGRSVVDLGTMDPAKLDTCRADYAIISHYDRYAAERAIYGQEIATYDSFLKGSVLLQKFSLQPGRVGGPTVMIFRLPNPPKVVAPGP